MAETTPPTPGAEEQRPTGQLGIQKIYTKDVSFESPSTPEVFTREWKPAVEVSLANKGQKLNDQSHEVVLTVTVTARCEDKVAYLVEVHQAGIFNIAGFPDQIMPALLATVCPNILFPFARQVVTDLVTGGGFPQLLLSPVNFEALYAKELERQRQQAGEGGQGAAPAGNPPVQ